MLGRAAGPPLALALYDGAGLGGWVASPGNSAMCFVVGACALGNLLPVVLSVRGGSVYAGEGSLSMAGASESGDQERSEASAANRGTEWSGRPDT